MVPKDVPNSQPQPEIVLFRMYITNDLHQELLKDRTIQQIEDMTNTHVYFPQHILHATFGTPENQTELHVVKQEDLVFIHGTCEDCEAVQHALEVCVYM
jgi:hypothetical protein